MFIKNQNVPMKQSTTIENEMMMYLRQTLTDSKCSNEKSSLPGKQVVNNIMNYARSLQVLKSKTADTIFLIGN
jgi:hypothetical protein